MLDTTTRAPERRMGGAWLARPLAVTCTLLQGVWRDTTCHRSGSRGSQLSNGPQCEEKVRDVVACMSIHRIGPWCCLSMRVRFRRTAPFCRGGPVCRSSQRITTNATVLPRSSLPSIFEPGRRSAAACFAIAVRTSSSSSTNWKEKGPRISTSTSFWTTTARTTARRSSAGSGRGSAAVFNSPLRRRAVRGSIRWSAGWDSSRKR